MKCWGSFLAMDSSYLIKDKNKADDMCELILVRAIVQYPQKPHLDFRNDRCFPINLRIVVLDEHERPSSVDRNKEEESAKEKR